MPSDGIKDENLKWDQRFREQECVLGTEPSPYLADNLALIKSLVPGLRALDIACGEGRNSIFLAEEGFRVTGIDISQVGLEKARRWMERKGLQIDFRQADLRQYVIAEQYDLIINCNFLLRDLIPKSVAALAPKGVLVFDTLLDSPHVPTTRNKEHLLQPGELVRIFSSFEGEILLPEELPYDTMPTARLIFRKG